MPKKVCKKCKYVYEGNQCPICKIENPAQSWQGRIFVLEPNKSMIAKNISIAMHGEYAIKVR